MRYVRMKRLKTVPKALLIIWVVLFASLVFCTAKTFFPSPLLVDDAKHDVVAIIDASLYDSRDIRGSRFKLVIETNDKTFYLWYPVESFSKYKDVVERDLLTGSVSQVSISYLSDSTIQDIMTGHCRVVDLRSDNEVYYSFDDEISRCQSSKSTYLVLSIILLLMLILFTFVMTIIYGVVSFRAIKKKQ